MKQQWISNITRGLFALAILLVCVAETSASDAKASVDKLPAEVNSHKVLRPMLWKVEGKDLAQPSWLFGTIHISDSRVIEMHRLSKEAFEQSDAVLTEIAMDAKSSAKAEQDAMCLDGTTLDQRIGPELTLRLDSELKRISPMLSVQILAPLKTWAVALTLPVLKELISGKPLLDYYLWEQATEKGKKTFALETAEQHSACLNAMTEKEQQLLLKIMLDGLEEERESKRDSMKEMLAVYLRGDTKALIAFEEEGIEDLTPEEDALNEKLMIGMLDVRNEIMANVIVKHLKEHPERIYFFAAGTRHYCGEDNVGDLLVKKGYTVTRVEPTEEELATDIKEALRLHQEKYPPKPELEETENEDGSKPVPEAEPKVRAA